MNLPENALSLIREYSKPLTRPDWRDGSNCCNIFKYSDEIRRLHQNFLSYYYCASISKEMYDKYNFIARHTSLIQDLVKYGEDIFELIPQSAFVYNNFYFVLKKDGILKNCGKLLIRHLVGYFPDKKIEIIHASELGIKN